jgi:hypothetical protein
MFGFVYLLIFQFREAAASSSLFVDVALREKLITTLEVDVLARPYELTPPPEFSGRKS